MVIDFHTHAFPDRIARFVLAKLSYDSGGLIPQTKGTVHGLKDLMRKDGVDKSVLLSIATNEKQQAAVNDFALSCRGDEIIPFGSVYPWAEDALSELERIKEMGLQGIKFHPEYQQFFVDDEKMKPIYKKASELGLIILFHAGEDMGYPPPYHATPERLRRAMKWIDTTVVCAHWGSANMGEDVLKYLCDIPVFFDTAFGYGAMPKDRALRIMDKKGADLFLFGSDCPWHAPSWEMELLETLGLSQDEKDKIYFKNAQKLLQI